MKLVQAVVLVLWSNALCRRFSHFLLHFVCDAINNAICGISMQEGRVTKSTSSAMDNHWIGREAEEEEQEVNSGVLETPVYPQIKVDDCPLQRVDGRPLGKSSFHYGGASD